MSPPAKPPGGHFVFMGPESEQEIMTELKRLRSIGIFFRPAELREITEAARRARERRATWAREVLLKAARETSRLTLLTR